MTTALRTTDVIRVAVHLPMSPGTRYRRIGDRMDWLMARIKEGNKDA